MVANQFKALRTTRIFGTTPPGSIRPTRFESTTASPTHPNHLSSVHSPPNDRRIQPLTMSLWDNRGSGHLTLHFSNTRSAPFHKAIIAQMLLASIVCRPNYCFLTRSSARWVLVLLTSTTVWVRERHTTIPQTHRGRLDPAVVLVESGPS